MRPVLATNNAANHQPGDRESPTDFNLIEAFSVQAPDLCGVCRCYAGVRILFAIHALRMYLLMASTLAHHVSAVVGLCAEKQVLRIDTGSDVAGVQYAQAFRNLTNQEFIRGTMRAYRASVKAYSAITVCAEGSGPSPAGVCFLDKFPKPASKRDGFHGALIISLGAPG